MKLKGLLVGVIIILVMLAARQALRPPMLKENIRLSPGSGPLKADSEAAHPTRNTSTPNRASPKATPHRPSTSAASASIPRDMVPLLEPAFQRYRSGLETTGNAQRRLLELEKCVANAKRISIDVPGKDKRLDDEALKAKIRNMPYEIQASCLRSGFEIIQKFPSLKAQFHARVMSQADRRAVQLLEKQLASEVNRNIK